MAPEPQSAAGAKKMELNHKTVEKSLKKLLVFGSEAAERVQEVCYQFFKYLLTHLVATGNLN